MLNRFGEPCLWHADREAAGNLDSLQRILNCASVQGCGHCVKCSETALELFLKVAREAGQAEGGEPPSPMIDGLGA